MIIKGDTFAEVYDGVLFAVMRHPNYITSPRGMKIKELAPCHLEIHNPIQILYKNAVRSSRLKYICNEFAWYLSGDLRVEWIGKKASLWEKIAIDGAVESNYGYLMLRNEHRNNIKVYGESQYGWAFEILKNDKDSRQAVTIYNRSLHQYKGVKDNPCTLNVSFQIRENKLNMFVIMRSNDIIKGLPTDAAWFSLVHQHMFKHLQNLYPKIGLGKYYHTALSLHAYESDFDLIKRMLAHEFESEKMELNMPLWDQSGELTHLGQKIVDIVYDEEPLTNLSHYPSDTFADWIIATVMT